MRTMIAALLAVVLLPCATFADVEVSPELKRKAQEAMQIERSYKFYIATGSDEEEMPDIMRAHKLYAEMVQDHQAFLVDYLRVSRTIISVHEAYFSETSPLIEEFMDQLVEMGAAIGHDKISPLYDSIVGLCVDLLDESGIDKFSRYREVDIEACLKSGHNRMGVEDCNPFYCNHRAEKVIGAMFKVPEGVDSAGNRQNWALVLGDYYANLENYYCERLAGGDGPSWNQETSRLRSVHHWYSIGGDGTGAMSAAAEIAGKHFEMYKYGECYLCNDADDCFVQFCGDDEECLKGDPPELIGESPHEVCRIDPFGDDAISVGRSWLVKAGVSEGEISERVSVAKTEAAELAFSTERYDIAERIYSEIGDEENAFRASVFAPEE